MPMIRDRYPRDWDAIALSIKAEVGWSCEQCGRPCRQPGETVEQFATRLLEVCPNPNAGWAAELFELTDDEDDYVMRPQRFTLTVAHLDHNPSNCDRTNLKALCAPCHCRYDVQFMGLKRRLLREHHGQLNLFACHGEV